MSEFSTVHDCVVIFLLRPIAVAVLPERMVPTSTGLTVLDKQSSKTILQERTYMILRYSLSCLASQSHEVARFGLCHHLRSLEPLLRSKDMLPILLRTIVVSISLDEGCRASLVLREQIALRQSIAVLYSPVQCMRKPTLSINAGVSCNGVADMPSGASSEQGMRCLECCRFLTLLQTS